MSTKNKQKRAEKNRRKAAKRKPMPATPRCISSGYQFINKFPITISEAVGFPGLFRDVRLAQPPAEPIEESTGLKDLEFELLMYDSIHDRAISKSPLVSLLAKIHKSSFLSTREKSFIQTAPAMSCGDFGIRDFCKWRLNIELIEYIAPGSLYGDWNSLQGDDVEGVISIFIDADILVSRVPLDASINCRKSKKLLDIHEHSDYFHVETFAFSEESRARMHKLSGIQIDAAWFLMTAICASIPGLSAPSLPLQLTQSKIEAILKNLSDYENSLMPQLKAVIKDIRSLQCQIDSLEINSADRTTKRYVNCKTTLARLVKELELGEIKVIELTGNLADRSRQLSKSRDRLKESTKLCDIEKFKAFTIEVNLLKTEVESLEMSLKTASSQLQQNKKNIIKIESEIRLLESRLEISQITNGIKKLREHEVSLMTEIDRCLMERILLTSGYNAWALLNQKPPLVG